jgi:membrane carboxypeptidase/penicillin-binding protein
VRLLELAGAYRAMASGILAEPHIIDRVTDASGGVLLLACQHFGMLVIGGTNP